MQVSRRLLSEIEAFAEEGRVRIGVRCIATQEEGIAMTRLVLLAYSLFKNVSNKELVDD